MRRVLGSASQIFCIKTGQSVWSIFRVADYKSSIYVYKRPLDSYACPDQSKGNRTNQSTFLRGKNILKWCNFMGKSKMCVHSFSFSAQKALFLHPLETLNTTHIDPRYTLFSDQSVQLSDEVPSVKFEWWV